MDSKELAELLHNAGLNYFSHPQDKSLVSWNKYRMQIAEELLARVEVIPFREKGE